MIKNDKIYCIAGICSFLLHICVFVFVMVVGFLPFREGQNFYECFIGFFGETLSAIQPYLVMAILFLSGVMAFFAIKQPLCSCAVLVCSLSFFVIAVFPYSIEGMIVGLASPWIGVNMATYKISFELIDAASYIVYFDIAFWIYSVITLIIRARKNLK